SPFAPVYPSTNRSVPQRHKSLRRAQQLLHAATQGKRLSIEATAIRYQEVPLLAQIVQDSVKQVGIQMKLNILNPTPYFAGKPNATPWLNAPMTMTGWSSRAVPNVFLTSALMSNGVWNAAHYKNKQFDALTKSYLSAISLKDQRKYAKQLETL